MPRVICDANWHIKNLLNNISEFLFISNVERKLPALREIGPRTFLQECFICDEIVDK